MSTAISFSKRIFALILVLAAGTFLAACESSTSNSNGPGIQPSVQPPQNGPIATTTTVSFSPSANVTVGTPVTVTAATTPASGTITSGTLSIAIAVDSFGNYTSSANAVNWVTLNSATGASCNTQFVPTAAGSYGFRAHYVPQGSGFHESKSPGTDLVVIEVACSGSARLTAELSSASSENPYTFTVTYRVHACQELSNVKLQGGLVAGVQNVSGASSLSTAVLDTKNTKQNAILSWKIPYMADGQEETFSVTYTKKITSFPATITGAWSLKDANGNLLDSYTNPMVFDGTPTP